VSASDYIIDGLLVLLVLRQIRPRQLTPRSIVLPIVLLAVAGSEYLKGFPTGGNDLWMDVVLVVAGAAFGVVSGLATKVWIGPEGQIMCRAGVVAATAWVLGMGIRMGFDIWANSHSGLHHLVSFSVHHRITSPQAYATAFVLMAFAQVLIRIGILQARRVSASPQSAPALA
jgi:hypothetical protein